MSDDVLPIIPEEDYQAIWWMIERSEAPEKLPPANAGWCHVIDAKRAAGVWREEVVTLADFQRHMASINADPLKPTIPPSSHALFQCARIKADMAAPTPLDWDPA